MMRRYPLLFVFYLLLTVWNKLFYGFSLDSAASLFIFLVTVTRVKKQGTLRVRQFLHSICVLAIYILSDNQIYLNITYHIICIMCATSIAVQTHSFTVQNAIIYSALVNVKFIPLSCKYLFAFEGFHTC
jgi:hypothetical protein